MEGMRIVCRCYEDGVMKPHIGETFKADVTSEEDVEEAVEAFREFIYDRFSEWQELKEGEDDSGDE